MLNEQNCRFEELLGKLGARLLPGPADCPMKRANSDLVRIAFNLLSIGSKGDMPAFSTESSSIKAR